MIRQAPPRAEHPRLVVAGVDGSEQGWSALTWAADEASLRGARLRVLHACDAPCEEPRTASDATLSGADRALAIVDAARTRVAVRHPSLEVRVDASGDRAPYALIEASCSADLLVVGAQGLGEPAGSPVLGSVSERCIRYAHCPVVVVRWDAAEAPSPPTDLTVVVGTDGSLGSTRALRWALREGRSRGASVRAVFAWQHPAVPSKVTGALNGNPAVAREITQSARVLAARFEPDVPLVADDSEGATVPVLLGASGGADLLVVGAGRRDTPPDALVGSVAHQCILTAPCPVAVVQPSNGELDGLAWE
jgi:nucleotide-binding universal stress UspA family protein